MILYDDVEEQFPINALLILRDMDVNVIRCDGVNLTEKLQGVMSE